MNKVFLFCILFISQIAFSQNVNVIKITDLENRINNDSDTTYIVNFWATWCVPCVKELPEFEEINKAYSNKKVKVLLVSMDFKEDLNSKLIPFINRKDIRSEVLLLDELNGNYFIPKIHKDWSGTIPATLIKNNSKKFIELFEKKVTYYFLEEKINSLL